MIKPKIALVEDDYLLVLVMSKHLATAGYECESFASAEEFLQKVSINNDYKAIVLDIKLKGKMDGVELFKHFSELYTTPVIFATGNSDVPELKHLDKNQVKAVLIKPIHLEELSDLIEQL
jgi:DNA-binding NtrC family response regulator